MRLFYRLRRIVRADRGTSIVEYVGVTGIALIVAALIMAGITSGRFRLGAAMANIHDRQIISFENGMPGQANTDADLFPSVPMRVSPRTVIAPPVIIPVVVQDFVPDPPVELPPIIVPPILQLIVMIPVVVQDAVTIPAIVQEIVTIPPPVIPAVVQDVVAIPAVVQDAIPDLPVTIPMVTMLSVALLAALLRRNALTALPANPGSAATLLASAGAQASIPPWLAAVGQVLLGLLIGVAALLALAAVIYGVAALLAALGIGAAISFATALIIAGIVLAVGFLALEFWNRLQEFRRQRGEPGFWDYLQIAALSLASLTGIPQIIEALRGSRLLSDMPLSEVERWQLGIGGVVQFAVFLAGIRVALSRIRARRTPGATGAKTAPGSGAGGNGTASEFGDMTGMSRTAADAFLRSRGASVSTTAGGYTRYKFPDRSEVWIRPDGEVVRIPAPQYGADGRRINKGARLDQNGQPTTDHNTGEKVIDP
jgi:hypothetical protein